MKNTIYSFNKYIVLFNISRYYYSPVIIKTTIVIKLLNLNYYCLLHTNTIISNTIINTNNNYILYNENSN